LTILTLIWDQYPGSTQICVLHSGLKLLGEFIDLNGGCIQIVSDAGYWRREDGKTFTAPVRGSFPGTVVSLEINTADTNLYKLVSELSSANIF